MWTKEGLVFLMEQCERMSTKCLAEGAAETCTLVTQVYKQLREELDRVVRIENAEPNYEMLPAGSRGGYFHAPHATGPSPLSLKIHEYLRKTSDAKNSENQPAQQPGNCA